MPAEQYDSLFACVAHKWDTEADHGDLGDLIVVVGWSNTGQTSGETQMYGPFAAREFTFAYRNMETEKRYFQAGLEVRLTEVELAGWFLVGSGIRKEHALKATETLFQGWETR